MTRVLSRDRGDRAEDTATTRDLALMIAILAAAGLVAGLWAWWGGERIPTHNGLGFDGHTYGKIARDPSLIFEHRLDMHRIARVLPSVIAFLLIAPFGLPASNEAVVAAFQVLNYAALAVAALLWWQVARHLRLTRPVTWIGFIFLFVNYPSLKLSGFYPVLTDDSGFLLGMVLVWLVVTRRSWWLLALALVGAFTWPTVTYSALLVFILDRRDTRTPRAHAWWGIGAALAAALVVAYAALHAHSCGVRCVAPVMMDTTVETVLPLSVILVAAWTFLALQPPLARLTPKTVLGSIIWTRIPIAFALIYLISLFQHAVANESARTLGRTLWNTSLGSVAKPLGFLVVHTAYYGPGVLLLVFTWPLAVRLMAQFGPRVLALIAVFVVLGVGTQSRIVINEWPLFALAAALVAHELKWSWRETWILAVLAAVTSRMWMPIHHGPITGAWKTYPSQWYFMNKGETTTVLSLLMLTVLAVVNGIVVWHLLHGRRKRADEIAPPDERPVGHEAAPVPGGSTTA